MTNTDDQNRIKCARMALCHIAALDVRKKTPYWDAKGEAALREAEATIGATPGRLLLQAIRQMREGGPTMIDPLGPIARDTGERSRRPQHGREGQYDTAVMRTRRA